MEENTRSCPHCGKELAKTPTTKCPYCGTHLGQAPLSAEQKKVSRLAVGSILMTLVFVFLLLAGENMAIRIPLIVEVVFFVLWLISPCAGLVLSIFALREIARPENDLRGPGLAVAGFVANLLICLGILILPAFASGGPPLNKWILALLAFAVLGLIYCVNAFFDVRHSHKKSVRKKPATVGIALSAATILTLTTLLVICSRRGGREISCENNLKALGIILDMYASENGDRFPPIDDTRNNFILGGNVTSPEYMPEYPYDTSLLDCPSAPGYAPKDTFRLRSTDHHPDSSVGDLHPDCITDKNYIYLGWVVTSDEEAEAFFEAYDKLSPEDYDKDIIVADGKGNSGGNVIHRLKKGAKSFPNDPSKTAADIPVIWDKPFTDITEFSHIPAGGNILYLDGHLEHTKFGEKFPMSKTMARLLEERPRAPIPDCEPLED